MTEFCCVDMAHHASLACEQHSNPFDCPDALIYRSKHHNCHGIIIHDGGSSFVVIKFCPWCGTKLNAVTFGRLVEPWD